MELKVSPLKFGISPSDCVSDPEEKEISDDDDRNHKHRRRESETMERESLEQILTKPYRKRYKPLENGHPYKEGYYQPSGTWKHHNVKFEKKMPELASFSRAHVDINKKIRMNQSLPMNFGHGQGRERESSSWSQHNSRFSSVDIMSQMVQHRSVPSNLFAGMAIPNVSNSLTGSWNTFNLVPGIPSAGLDTLNSLSLRGTHGQPINLSMNTGIPRQRCRDFEELGFCLRGDMCPMEHGINRIVIEDVQSLSEFNLPVSLPSAVGARTGPGPLSATSTTSTLMNDKGLQEKNGKPGMSDGISCLNGSAVAGGTDFYDPDQPLWTNDRLETSVNPFNVDETELLLDTNPSDHHYVGSCGDSNLECPVRSAGNAVGSSSANLSAWGGTGNSKFQSEMKEKFDYSNYKGSETKENQEPLNRAQNAVGQGKHAKLDGVGPHAVHSSLKMKSDSICNMRKPSQKAFRTLFVNGIPQENNKKEALLSHFRKFGKVIDIYIPQNGERAFVQFSKREEAGAALKAPDAVMGNRFIKLFWANRDRIPDDGINNNSGEPPPLHGLSSVQPHLSVAKRGIDAHRSSTLKGSIAPVSVAPVDSTVQLVPVADIGPKVLIPLQKKVDTLELLKKELREKQEMLDKKRKDFREQLDKLEKHATVLKGEITTDQSAKKPKVGVLTDVSKASSTKCNDHNTVSSLHQDQLMVKDRKCAEITLPHGSKSNSRARLHHESSCTEQSIHPLAPLLAQFIMKSFKRDIPSSTFKILPPLPTGLADVGILIEHFSTFGDLSTVDLEDLEEQENNNDSVVSKISAHISFKTQDSAERAFLNGKYWQGHNLQFAWFATSSNSIEDTSSQEKITSVKRTSDADMELVEESESTGCQAAVVLGHGESEDSERKERIEMHNEQHENFQFRSTATSHE